MPQDTIEVDTRERFRDWEVDTVLGKHSTGALVTLAERKSRMYLVKRVDAKRACSASIILIGLATIMMAG